MPPWPAAPALLLVDELAHTNAPGSRHAKRWEDVEELLAAGLDVWATLNVQHLESLNDDVARITGVRVAETLPDRVLEGADEIELIDVPPGRAARPPGRAAASTVPTPRKRALDGYFKAGNLAALREIALRQAAAHVDDDVRDWMRDKPASAGPWPAGRAHPGAGWVGCGRRGRSASCEAAGRRAARPLDRRCMSSGRPPCPDCRPCDDAGVSNLGAAVETQVRRGPDWGGDWSVARARNVTAHRDRAAPRLPVLAQGHCWAGRSALQPAAAGAGFCAACRAAHRRLARPRAPRVALRGPREWVALGNGDGAGGGRSRAPGCWRMATALPAEALGMVFLAVVAAWPPRLQGLPLALYAAMAGVPGLGFLLHSARSTPITIANAHDGVRPPPCSWLVAAMTGVLGGPGACRGACGAGADRGAAPGRRLQPQPGRNRRRKPDLLQEVARQGAGHRWAARWC